MALGQKTLKQSGCLEKFGLDVCCFDVPFSKPNTLVLAPPRGNSDKKNRIPSSGPRIGLDSVGVILDLVRPVLRLVPKFRTQL